MSAYLHPADIGGRAYLAPSDAPVSQPSTVTAVTVSPPSVALAGGATQQFTATVLGANNPYQGVTWTHSPALGTISGAGVFTAPAATSSVQTFTVRATSTQDAAYYGESTVTVAALPAEPGETRQLVVSLKFIKASKMSVMHFAPINTQG